MKHNIRFFIFHALVALMLTVSCTEARAQNTITVVGTFVKEGKTPPRDAVEEAKIFQSIAGKLPMKEKTWKWIIIADDTMWKQLMNKLGFDVNTPYEYYGQTDIEGKTTFIRGWTLLYPDQFVAAPEHVIAHEMAHVYLHSRDEKLVDETAQRWMVKLASDNNATTATTAGLH